MNTPMMKCGHTANATDREGNPSCVICIGIHPGAEEVATESPSLAGRMARCSCGRTQPSSTNLAFFEYRGPGSEAGKRSCKHCGYYSTAHNKETMSQNVHGNRKTVVELGKCPGFEPRGAFDFDEYYCGCRGWD